MLESYHYLDLPYITESSPGIGGQLRVTPEHFVVDELPLYEPEDQGQHLYVRLTKVGMTTKDVQKQLEKLFEQGRNDVGFAGMKDKHARTTQTFSLKIGHQSDDFPAEAIKRIEENMSVTVEWARLHKNKLKNGHLLGNRFTIVITDLDMPAAEALEQVQSIAQQLRTSGLPNYFGPQRFGFNGQGIERGLAILLRQQYVKEHWLRRFLVTSYQSYLCNCYLSRRVQMGAFDQLLLGDIAKKYDTGGIFDVEDVEMELPRYAKQEISFTAPLYGPKMREAHQDAGALESEILDSSPITIDDLRRAKTAGTRRLGRLLIPDFTARLATAEDRTEGSDENLEKSSGQEALVVEFSLPKGAFATTVLREIMKVDLTHVPNLDHDN